MIRTKFRNYYTNSQKKYVLSVQITEAIISTSRTNHISHTKRVYILKKKYK